MTERTRFCVRCKTDKAIDEFQNIGIGDYKRRVCKGCISAYKKALYFGQVKPLDRGADSRKCRRCGESKPIDQFPLLVGKYSFKGWRKHTCIVCDHADHAARASRHRKKLGEVYRARNRLRHQKNYPKYLESKIRKRHEIKRLVMEQYGGMICKCCGETCDTMLTIDHISEDGAEHRRSLTGGRERSVNMYFYLKQNGFPAGFQVLCYNCNISKHRNGGICQHHTREGSTTIPKGSTPKRAEARAIP